MDHTQLIQGFSDQIKVTDAHFLDSFGCWGNTSLKHFCLLVLVLVLVVTNQEAESGRDGVATNSSLKKVAEPRVTGKTKLAILETV